MKLELSPLWRKITLRRHQSALRALQAVRFMPRVAVFPIFLTVGCWYFLLAGIPCLILFLLQQVLYSATRLLGVVVLAVNSMAAIVTLVLIAPWVFRWYFIAVGLAFGHTALAARKQTKLVAAVAAAERDAIG